MTDRSSDNPADDSLLSIFLAEAEDIIARLQEQLADLQYGYDSQPVLKEVHNSFQTLYGGSRVLDRDSMAELARAGAEIIQQLRGRRVVLGPKLTALIKTLVDELARMLDMAKQGLPLPDIDPELRRRLAPIITDDASQSPGRQSVRPSRSGASRPGYGSELMELLQRNEGRSASRPLALATENETLGGLEVLDTLPGEDWQLSTPQHQPPVQGELLQQIAAFSQELSWVSDVFQQLQNTSGDTADQRRRAVEFLTLLAEDFRRFSQRQR